MFYWQEQRDMKILWLQLRKPRSRVFASITGEFLQKSQLGATERADDIRRHLSEVARTFRWKMVPRARVAVEMCFFATKERSPALHNLVKYYLDSMCSTLFTDDRQVWYLAAHYCRVPRRDEGSTAADEATVHISVERLSDYCRRLFLYDKVAQNRDFQRYLRSNHPELIDHDDDDRDPVLGRSDYLSGLNDLPFRSEEARQAYRQFMAEERQRWFLTLSRISSLNRPGIPRWANILPIKYEEIRYLDPFAIDLGYLPGRDQTKAYKEGIRQSLRLIKNRYPLFDPIVVPFELDVQVTLQRSRLGKDLDNVMRDIAPAVNEELLRNRARLEGYRIYAVGSPGHGQAPGHLRLKLLPYGAIWGLDKVVDRTLEVAKGWLSEQIHLRWSPRF